MRHNPARILALMAMAMALFACNCGASQRSSTLDTTTKTLVAAYAGFNAFDEAHQRNIIDRAVAEAKTEAEAVEAGDKALNAWIKKRDVVKDTVIAALTAVSLARVNTDTPLAEITAKVAAAYEAMDKVKKEVAP